MQHQVPFHHYSSVFVTGGQNQDLHLWTLENAPPAGARLVEMKTVSGLASPRWDTTFRVKAYRGHPRSCFSATHYSPLILRNLETGSCIREYPFRGVVDWDVHEPSNLVVACRRGTKICRSLAFCPLSQKVSTAGTDTEVDGDDQRCEYIWKTNVIECASRTHINKVRFFSSPTRSLRALAVSTDGILRMWDVNAMRGLGAISSSLRTQRLRKSGQRGVEALEVDEELNCVCFLPGLRHGIFVLDVERLEGSSSDQMGRRHGHRDLMLLNSDTRRREEECIVGRIHTQRERCAAMLWSADHRCLVVATEKGSLGAFDCRNWSKPLVPFDETPRLRSSPKVLDQIRSRDCKSLLFAMTCHNQALKVWGLGIQEEEEFEGEVETERSGQFACMASTVASGKCGGVCFQGNETKKWRGGLQAIDDWCEEERLRFFREFLQKRGFRSISIDILGVSLLFWRSFVLKG